MAAFVDEAALRVVLGLLGPGAQKIVVDGRAAAGAAVGGLPFHELEDVSNGQELVGADRLAHCLVAVVGAATHGFRLGRSAVVAACGEHQDLLDQARARAARCAGLGVFLDLLQREQTLVLDGLADRAFGHAVAATHLVGVGHGRCLALALVAHVAQVRFAKHQLVAQVAHAAAIAQ
ncbi:hypothetical protein D3C72_1663510 [compost metagenome]